MGDWKEDTSLKEDLVRYVEENMTRKEILLLLQTDYSQYAWSLPTLDRRLRHFNIFYINACTPLQVVEDAMKEELNGPGKLLGYRAMNHRLRTEHHIKVPRHLVYHMLGHLDSEGLENRNVWKKKKRPKVPFTSDGPLWVVSLDGHDKLCGYQNHTFPLGMYGGIDTFSRKVLFLHVVYSNSNPLVIGKMYLEFLYRSDVLPVHLRMDRGTETGKMATIHSYLRNSVQPGDDPLKSILYGPSTSNKIERWWRDLHERLEKYFKKQLQELLIEKHYDPQNLLDRQLLFYVYEPILSQECDKFVNYWNSHRIRRQKNIELPAGVPNHMFSHPEIYGGCKKGTPIDHAALKEVAELSDVLHAPNFLPLQLVEKCKSVIPEPKRIVARDAKSAFCFLKARF